MKQRFNERQYNANFSWLKTIRVSAEKLAAQWHQLNKTKLNSELFSEWLQDEDFIFIQHAKEKNISVDVWDILPDTDKKRPLSIHEKQDIQKHLRVCANTEFYRHDEHMFVSHKDLSWKLGVPHISQSTLDEFKRRCTNILSDRQQQVYEKLETYCDAYNEAYKACRTSTPRFTGKLPVRINAGSARIDETQLFRTVT